MKRFADLPEIVLGPLEGRPDGDWQLAPPGKWTSAQIVEHLALALEWCATGFEERRARDPMLRRPSTFAQRVGKVLVMDFGWFPPPVQNVGDKQQLCFLSDQGFALSKFSKNQAAAARYLDWVSTSDFAQLFMKNIPGMFTYIPGNYSLDPLANQILQVAKKSDLTERLMTEKLSAQAPSGTDLLDDASVKLVLGEFTPEQAAEYVQKNLETWFKFQ